jgi:hypothetical protein
VAVRCLEAACHELPQRDSFESFDPLGIDSTIVGSSYLPVDSVELPLDEITIDVNRAERSTCALEPHGCFVEPPLVQSVCDLIEQPTIRRLEIAHEDAS